jgi:hypothetical protein
MLLLIVACDSQPEAPDIVALWEQDRAAATATILDAPDPITQLAYVDALSEAHPDQLGALCQALPAGAAAERCRTFSNRPHLWEITDASSSQREDHTGITTLTTDAGAVPAVPAPGCEGQTEQCRITAAKAIAPTADLRGIAGLCNGLDDLRFRHECFFQSAEVALHTDYQKMPVAMELCLSAGDYASRCVRELARELARSAPPADNPAGPWGQIIGAIDAGHDWLAARDPAVGERMRDRLWSEVVWGSFGRAGNITGDLLGQLPPQAAPHIRASAAWYLIESGQGGDSLASWEAATKAALAVRDTPGPMRQGVQPTRRLGVSRAVSDPWVHFLGDSPRPVSPDAEVDLRLALLEIAASRRQWMLVRDARRDPALAERAEALLESVKR